MCGDRRGPRTDDAAGQKSGRAPLGVIWYSGDMANPVKAEVLDDLRRRYGDVRKLKGSESLFSVAGTALVYFRYSKVHPSGRAFFGLREADLRQLEGQDSYICFLLDDGTPPVFVPYADFEEVFRGAEPARDGQYKAQLITRSSALELYVARRGRFNVEGYVGYGTLRIGTTAIRRDEAAKLSHFQVQTLIAGIGHLKGHDVHVPENDVNRLDWSLVDRFPLRAELPGGFEDIRAILAEIDVLWVGAARPTVEGLFEIEHSTPIYSGLLRLNDVLLTDSRVSRFSVVSNDERRDLFSRQLFRPTFRRSGLAELCSFLEYGNVLSWYQRMKGERK